VELGEREREHERTVHGGRSVIWRRGANGELVCDVCWRCRREAPPESQVAEGWHAPCEVCGSRGRCEKRQPLPDGGWVCEAAAGLFDSRRENRLERDGEEILAALGCPLPEI
jgi:hypothetical protein